MSHSKKLTVPRARNFDWELKPISSAYFKVIRNKSNQICVVLEHALLRGVSTEMIHWWFHHFTKLNVRLIDIPGYEGKTVPAYLLWHPSDHVSAELKGKLGPGGTPRAGAKIHIKETMQYEKYGLKYPVDQELMIFYHDKDGWGMGKTVPWVGPMMSLRISFKDVYEGGKIIGVHYHYEVVAGSYKQNFVAQKLTNKIVGNFGTEFWNAWLTHNTIEVGVFENFLPVLFEQRNHTDNISYAKEMNPITESPAMQNGFSKSLFEARVKGYSESINAFEYQGVTQKSFL
ncbi:MAG: hypothetical protein AAF765_03175 [Bacteroidota bacterium]